MPSSFKNKTKKHSNASTKDVTRNTGCLDSASSPHTVFSLKSVGAPHPAALVMWLDHTLIFAHQEKCSLKASQNWGPYSMLWVKVTMFPHLKFVLLHQTAALLTALMPLLPTAEPCSHLSSAAASVATALTWQFGHGEAITSTSFSGKKGLEMGLNCHKITSPQVKSLLTAEKFLSGWRLILWFLFSAQWCFTSLRHWLTYSNAPVFWWIVARKTVTPLLLCAKGVTPSLPTLSFQALPS